MNKIVLATTSALRIEAFKQLGLDFVTEESNVYEHFEGRSSNPGQLVVQLAMLKAKAVAKRCPENVVIGFDSVGYFEGIILEKPKTKKEDFERLKMLSGRNHYYYTGIHMINLKGNMTCSNVVETKISMRVLSNAEITRYLDQDPKFKTHSLGYDILGSYSSAFIRRIEGSYNNLARGIPLEAVVEMLPKVGYKFS